MKYSLAKIRTAARELLTLDEKDPKRLFEGNALLRRLVRTGVLAEDKMKLDYVLALKTEDFMERRLQTQVLLFFVNIFFLFNFFPKGVQAGAGQVRPPRQGPHQAETHPREEAGMMTDGEIKTIHCHEA